jgi:amidase
MATKKGIPNEANIAQLRALMSSKRISSVQLIRHYQDRISRLDKNALNSVLEVNPDALKIAQKLDAERAKGISRGVLHGIPVLLKDNINTADKLHTSAGSLALKDSRASEDAALVSKLREAGAIILGKTNMTEWANFISTNMPNGYSSRGGQVLNPYGKTFNTGGSSSGSGVAVAADLCVVAVGTETSGSILSPANNNSVVGIKPTVGLISRRGIIPIAASQDTAGPMARNITDAAILLGAMTGFDARDPATKGAKSVKDYTVFLEKDGLKGMRLGVPRDYYWQHVKDDQKPILERALQALQDGGAVLVDPAEIESAQAVADLSYTVLLYEFKRDLNKYLRSLESGFPRSLLELIRHNENNHKKMLRYGQTLLLAAQSTSGTNSDLYKFTRAEDVRLSRQKGIDVTLKKYKLDALVMPIYWGAQIGAKAGYPSICVPAGYSSDGNPVGITFMGTAWSEPTLIRAAYAFEQLTNARRAPKLL